MSRSYILVEGSTDAAFLRRILPQDVLGDVELVNAGGSRGIPSLARSLLVRRSRPVAVVMDSDSLNQDDVEERRQSAEEFIRSANASVPVKVISIVPEIEAWFFSIADALETMVGGKVSTEWLSLGKRDPKNALRQLAEKNQRRWDTEEAIQSLDASAVERIRALPEVVELTAFLRETARHDQAA